MTDDSTRGLRLEPDVPPAIMADVPESERKAAREAWLRLEPHRREMLAGSSHGFAVTMLRHLAIGWDPLAPLNRLPDSAGGGWARKVRFAFPNGGGEWVWVRVASPDAITGELMNEPERAPNGALGSSVGLRLTPDGFAEAVLVTETG